MQKVIANTANQKGSKNHHFDDNNNEYKMPVVSAKLSSSFVYICIYIYCKGEFNSSMFLLGE